MQKIIILADGQIAKNFLCELFTSHLHEGAYEIVYFNDDILPVNVPDFIKKHKFDPTSEYKLSKVVTNDTAQVYIVLQNEVDAKICIKLVEQNAPAAQIIALNLWDLQKTSQTLKFVDANQTLTAQLLRYMPSALPIAQNVGLGLGEITEVQVVYGSKYVFRHISSIEQKNWRIAAIYRQNQLLLPKPNLAVRPNDSLLLVGQPAILKDVYKAFKSELGQFPQPFGSVVYVLVDARWIKKERFEELMKAASFLNKTLKSKKLVVRIVKPDLRINKFVHIVNEEGAIAEFDYQDDFLDEILINDNKKYNIGLVVVCDAFIAKKVNRKTLAAFKKPILKIGKEDIFETKQTVIAIDKSLDWEALSGVFFDVATQLNIKTQILNFEKDDVQNTIEHYQNLSNLYASKLEIKTDNSNPMRYLAMQKNLLHVLPLEPLAQSFNLKDIFFPKTSKLLRLLKSKNQLFIPS